MIGQEKLINRLNQYTVDTFPHTIILLGPEGCGKHTVAKYIADNIIKFPLVDLDQTCERTASGATLNVGSVRDIINKVANDITNPRICLIPSDSIRDDIEGVLLKFLEEPYAHIFNIIVAESKDELLDTILNRCIIFEFESYTKEQLATFIKEDDPNKELILSAVKTPGQIINNNLDNIAGMMQLVDKIPDSLSKASFENMLSIANKINYKDEFNKYDMNIFLNALSNTLFERYRDTNNKKMLEMYLLLGEQRKLLSDKRIVKDIFMQHLLIQLWKCSRSL